MTGYSGGKKKYGHAIGLPPAPKELKEFALQRELEIATSESRKEFYSRINSQLQIGSYDYKAARSKYVDNFNLSIYTRCFNLIPDYLIFNNDYRELTKTTSRYVLHEDLAYIIYCLYSQMSEEKIISNLDDLFLELRDSIIAFYIKENP